MHLGMRNIAESVIELKNRKPCSILELDEGRDENTPFWRAAAPDALGDGYQVLRGSSRNVPKCSEIGHSGDRNVKRP